MTLESMAAQVVHRVNPSGSHVTYDQLRKFLNVNYDRDSKCSVIYHCIFYLLSYWMIWFWNNVKESNNQTNRQFPLAKKKKKLSPAEMAEELRMGDNVKMKEENLTWLGWSL